jgi:uncharacterized membrane protein
VDGIFHLREPSEPRSWGHQPLPDRATLRERRLLLALGAIGAVASTVSGLVAHLAYQDDPVFASAIEVHQYTAFAATAIFAALAAWRWFSLRRGSDIGGTRAYLTLAVLGLILLGVTGLLGGNLLTEWGIGVEGVTR